MTTINLNEAITSIDGTQIKENDKPVTLGMLLGQQLAGSNKGEALKFYDWAVSLYKGDEISVDDTDLEKIKTFVKDSEQLTNLAKAQILKNIK